ncbi:unnamed protein product [Allacma fusca]|uniref:S-phase kinase-associated protein 1 n=1 Tax=Allacma fusca TaxID=39272 RepID=A0A8J2LR38_9HEXA|nr:unnamed protein product [Allacma fusca]
MNFFKMPSQQIKLQSSDGEIFDVEVKVAQCSMTIKQMLEDLGMEENDEEVIPLPNVSAAILRKVIHWANHHKDDPPPAEDDENKEKRTDDISSWDADFLKVDQGTLFELILAANYLDIKGLLDVTCKTVANMIKGKTPEEIRKTFNIRNDFSPAEEEQVRKENEWCEEKEVLVDLPLLLFILCVLIHKMGLLVGMGKITAVASLILSCGPCYVSPARNQSTGIFSIPPFEHLFNKIAEMLKGNSPSKAKETIQKFVDQSLGHQRTPEILMTPNVSQGQESQTRGPAESTAISDGLQRLKQKAREDLKNPSPRIRRKVLRAFLSRYCSSTHKLLRAWSSQSWSSNSNLNVRRLGRGDSRENWDPIRSAREREFREKPPPMLKVAVVGDSAVGKTTICEAFASETGFTFSKKYHMTCGVQVYAKSIRLPMSESGGESNRNVNLTPLFPGAQPVSNDIMNERVNLILLDSSSKDIYLDLLPKYWEKLDGFVLVMDVSNPTSLDNSKIWLELVKGCLDPKMEMLGILIGNKIDVGEDRAVATKNAEEFASANNLHYFEVTAKQNSGLEPAFMHLAQEWATRKAPYKS